MSRMLYMQRANHNLLSQVSYKIMVGGEVVGSIRNNGRAACEIPEGNLPLQVVCKQPLFFKNIVSEEVMLPAGESTFYFRVRTLPKALHLEEITVERYEKPIQGLQ